MAGRGVRLAASPARIPGCISRNGAATLPIPTISAGPMSQVATVRKVDSWTIARP